MIKSFVCQNDSIIVNFSFISYSYWDKIYVLQQTTIILMENNSIVHILFTIETPSTQTQMKTLKIIGKIPWEFDVMWTTNAYHLFILAWKRISNIPHCWHISSCNLRWFTSQIDYIAHFIVPSFFLRQWFYYSVWWCRWCRGILCIVKNILHFYSLVRITIIITWSEPFLHFQPSDLSFTR